MTAVEARSHRMKIFVWRHGLKEILVMRNVGAVFSHYSLRSRRHRSAHSCCRRNAILCGIQAFLAGFRIVLPFAPK